MKPIVNYQHLGFPIIVGHPALVKPINHPYCSNLNAVRTSKVVKINESGFETENTMYMLVN